MNTLLAGLIVGTIFVASPIAHVGLRKHKKILNTLVISLTTIYTIFMFVFTLTQVRIGSNISIDIVNNGQWFSKNFNWNIFDLKLSDVFINLAMLFPCGYAVSHFTKNQKGWKRVLSGFVVGMALGFSIEMLQLCLPINRFPALSDILLNATSGMLGATTCVGATKIISKLEKDIETNINQEDFSKLQFQAEQGLKNVMEKENEKYNSKKNLDIKILKTASTKKIYKLQSNSNVEVINKNSSIQTEQTKAI